MKGTYPRLAAAVLLVLSLTVPGRVQNGVSVFSGQLYEGAELTSGYWIELEELVSHRKVSRADVEPDGAFRFHDVPYGDYLVKVETYYGDVVYQINITVRMGSGPLVIQMPGPKTARPPSGPVSAARLLHPPAKKAWQAFVEAQKLSEAHRFADAARQLERAIAISPGFADAYSNLGAQYIRMGRYEDGSSAIARAIQIGQANVVDLANLAYAQLARGNYGEALASARAAVERDPANANAQYILGFILAQDPRTLREAIPHLSQAAETIRSARIALEQAQAKLSARN